MLDKLLTDITSDATSVISKKILDTTKEIAKPLTEQAKFVSSPNFLSTTLTAWDWAGRIDGLHDYPRKVIFDSQQDFALYTQGYIEGEREKKKEERLDSLFCVGKIVLLGGGVLGIGAGIIKLFGFLFENKKGCRRK